MKACMKVTFLALLAAGSIATVIGLSAATAQEPATNQPALPPTFRTPLIRDLELVDQVKALAARIADLETRNSELTRKVAALEAKLATIKK